MTAIVISIIVAAAATGMHWLWGKVLGTESARSHAIRVELLSMLRTKDIRINELDADYKALAESYIRDTGKVFIRPVAQVPDRLPPAQPAPFRFKPPPWANPNADPKIKAVR